MTTNSRRCAAIAVWFLHTAASALLVLAGPALVAGQEADELVEDIAVQPTLLGEGGLIYQSDADIDGGGSMDVLRFDVGLLGTATLSERLRWRNTYFFGVHGYDFDGGGFAAGDPWETVLNMRLGSALTYAINDKWGVSGGGVFIFSPETDADWGDSFTGGGSVGVEYRHSETLFASVGVAVISQIEDDAAVTPMVGVNWLPAPQWTVRVGAVPASGGTAAAGEVAYRILEPLEIGLGLVYHQRRFRLDDSGPAREGVGVDNNLPVRLRLGWNITQNVGLHLLAGVVAGGEVELEDRRGDRLRKEDYDPAAYIGARIIGRL